MAFPRSVKDARARSRRKLAALERRAHEDLLQIAGFFDEGPVSTDIDMLLDAIVQGIEDLRASIDDEVLRWEEGAEDAP